MKQKYLLIVFTVLGLISARVTKAQMVGTDIFIPGHYLELGINNVSAFGTTSAPSGYYPYPGFGGSELAEVYDYGHDGWTTGTPEFYGDYTWPGSPFEGWELQINGVNNQAFTSYLASGSTISGSGTLTGNNVSYTDVGGQLTALWSGTASGGNLQINQYTRVDTNGNAAVITTTFKNTGTTPILNIYYERGCDPDNDEAHGGSFATNNTILHQNEDASHSVEADAEGALYSDHWSLCTKDCRAKAFFYTSWPISSSADLAEVWAETSGDIGTSQYLLGGTLDGDYAFGLVFNVGTIAAGDSTSISYAYVFNDAYSNIDSAFPEPQLVVDNIPAPNAPLPLPTIDTFNACTSAPGMATIPVVVAGGETGVWTWGSWTWAPTTGLATDTGIVNTVSLTTISGSITYTITGSDSSLDGTTCNHRVFYLTIISCNDATNNSPCVGDTLKLVQHGDSTGAAYFWYGPGGYTSNLQNPFIYPATFADAGTYYVVKTVAGVSDTSHTTVVITQPPSPGVTGNTAYCQNVGPFVPVTITTYPGDVVQWYVSATGGYPSSDEPVADLTTPGTYTAYVSQLDSTCESLREPVVITVNPTPPAPVTTNPVYCVNSTVPVLTATGINHVWYGPGILSSGTTAPPTPVTTTPAIEDYYVTQTSTFGCISDSTLDRVIILPPPVGPLTANLSYCQFAPTAALTAIGLDLKWYIGGVLIDSTPVPPNVIPGDMTWYVTQSKDSLGVTCQSDSTPLTIRTIYLPKFTITAPAFVCQYDSINLAFTGTSLNEPGYTWVIPNGSFIVDSTSLTGMPSIVVQFDSTDQNNYVYLTASDSNGFCQTTDTIRINVVPQPSALAYTNPNICLNDTTALSLAYKTPDAANFVWKIDNVEITSSPELNIIASGSNSGGPYSISWLDSGLHIIKLFTTTVEGCPSLITTDSVYVHTLPDASFAYTTRNGNFCVDDSVLFKASTNNESYLYAWSPERSFENVNKWQEWGRVFHNISDITLTVTDPFGCSASSSQQLTPGSCCTVAFPNAFTPSGNSNKVFRPIASGYHNYHDFRITNRWGQLIFSSASSDVAWDGTFNGVPQDGGVYFYYVKYDCGDNTFEEKGDVTLIR